MVILRTPSLLSVVRASAVSSKSVKLLKIPTVLSIIVAYQLILLQKFSKV